MTQRNNISRPPNWLTLFLKIWLVNMILASKVNSEEAGLMCISECSTCPVICSPPPPPTTTIPTPPPPPPSSPPHNYHPPPFEYSHPPPPKSASPPRPPKTAEQPPPPPPSPSWYPIWGNPPGPPSPSSYYYNTPTGQGPPSPGQRAPYPYYYFYASKASCLSLATSNLPLCFLVLLAFLRDLY